MKQTIAFVNNETQPGIDLMKKLAQQDFQVLCILKNEESQNELIQKLNATASGIEIVTCPKEACWEADIISFMDNEIISDELIQRIQKVATQKIILGIASKESTSSSFGLNKLEKAFPFSMAVMVLLDPIEKKAQITGEKDALKIVATVFKKAGYSTFTSES